MATAPSSKSSRLKVQAHRQRLRERGLRPVQLWVPDVDSPAFRVEAHRQSLLVSQGPEAAEEQAFVDTISEGIWSGE